MDFIEKFAITVLIFVLVMAVTTMTGCESRDNSVYVNAEDQEDLSGNVFGKDALIEIGDFLYYDKTTRIVYWWNDYLSVSQCSTTPSPYYAPNGLPYRYNPETNTFEEIGAEFGG